MLANFHFFPCAWYACKTSFMQYYTLSISILQYLINNIILVYLCKRYRRSNYLKNEEKGINSKTTVV
uniref:Uncharacterized protein n=1 Tax=Ciona intestinalis TaxID=7719 RepID=H2XT67_CIOIN